MTKHTRKGSGRPYKSFKNFDDNGKKISVQEHRKLESEKRKAGSVSEFLKSHNLVALKAKDFYQMQEALNEYEKEDEEVAKVVDEQIAEQVQEAQKQMFEQWRCPYCSNIIHIPKKIEEGEE